MKKLIGTTVMATILMGCNSGQPSNQSSYNSTQPNMNDSTVALSKLAVESFTSQQYANELQQIGTTTAKNLAAYYRQINPVKTIYKENLVFDCIPFEEQQSIIDLPAAQKSVAIHDANQILSSMKRRLSLPENQDIAKNMNLDSPNSCPFGYISQVRPTFNEPYKVAPGTLKSKLGVSLNWADLFFPGGSNTLNVAMNTQPVPGTPSPTVFFSGWDDDSSTVANGGNVTINQLWLIDSSSTQSVEFGWITWGGYAPYIFAYGNNNDWGTGLPGDVPLTAAPGTPFPANQMNNQMLSLDYIVASKGPGDTECGGDPSGCYALEVAVTVLGIRKSGFWLVGWYPKSYFDYQNFTTFETGMELHSAGSAENAFGTFFNAGTNLTQPDEQDFNLQSFGQVPGVSYTWLPSYQWNGLTFPASMTFGGSWTP